MDLFKLAASFSDWQQLLLFSCAITVIVGVFALYNYVRATRIKVDGKTAIEKMRAEFDGKIELSKIELERNRQERERLVLTITEEKEKREDKTLNRFADTIESLGKFTEATNRLTTSIYTKQDEDKEVRDANVKRLIDLQLTTAQSSALLLLKLDETGKAINEVKATTETALEAHRAELNKTNVRIDDVFQNTRHMLDKINALGITAAELKKELVALGRVEKIDEIGRLLVDMMHIVMGMNEKVQDIKLHDTDSLPALPGVDPVAMPTVSAAVGLNDPPRVRTGKTDPLPKLPVEEPRLTPPAVHDTEQFPAVTIAAAPPEDKPL